MKSILRIILWFEVFQSNLAVFENPFQLQALFGKMFEIDSIIRKFATVENATLKVFQEKVTMFRQEIEITAKLMGHEKNPKIPNTRGILG